MAGLPIDWGDAALDGDDLASSAPPGPKKAPSKFSRIVIAVFVGCAAINASTHLIFIQSKTNAERLLLDDAHHSVIYAIRGQQTPKTSFVIGLPYSIQTNDAYLADAPDETEIFKICGSPEGIKPFQPSPNANVPSPVLRCTFTGSFSNKINCLQLSCTS